MGVVAEVRGASAWPRDRHVDRITVAGGFALEFPIQLPDQPTASPDRRNHRVVLHPIDDTRHAVSAGSFSVAL